MQTGISSHVYFPQRLTPALLDTLAATGAQAIEVFAARHHFDYTNVAELREVAGWFAAHAVLPTLHMPLFNAEEEMNWSRHTAPSINLIDANKTARLEAMDEVKRALEAAEVIPFQSCVLHIGLHSDVWDTRALDNSMTSLEHLHAFAAPLGVKLLLENLTSPVARADHLAEIVRQGHFSGIGFCLDLGHAHLTEPVAGSRDEEAKSGMEAAFAAFGDRLAELHVHDNGGWQHGSGKDSHAWPGTGSIDWAAVAGHVAALKQPLLAMLEIGYDLGETEKAPSANARAAWSLLETPEQHA